MRIVSHEITRGSRYVTYKDDEPDFGFSWRAAYHRGNAPPNYPVPTLLGEVVHFSTGGYLGVVFINAASGDDWVYAYDCWNEKEIT